MRVLWFSPTSSLFNNDTHIYNGGGWVESLEVLISNASGIDLAISFFHAKDSEKLVKDNVTYYPILRKKAKGIIRLINNWACKIESGNYNDKFLSVIKDFNPDVIHIFGTEGQFPQILTLTQRPVIIHLQGLINGCNFAYYPPGISDASILFSRVYFLNNLLGNSPIFNKKRFEKQATRELSYFKKAKYVMGRTAWDKLVSGLLAPQATYFHVDEVLRPAFYEATEWKPKEGKAVTIISTISSTIYKGLDLIFKTAKVLKENTELLFEWRVLGIEENDKLLLFFQRDLNIYCKDCNIVISGKKNSSELIQLLQESFIFVHPSYIDNSPNSVCEAQMMGMPVIACNVGGVPSLIENSINGILVPSNAPFELADAISTLVANQELSSRLGQKAKQTAMERNNREKILNELLKIYKNLKDDCS